MKIWPSWPAMPAPTDATLGKAVVNNQSAPANMREGLNVENGFKEGICAPILFVFLALATGSRGEGGAHLRALKLVDEEIG